jgi:DNA invertase Pin-like site-specific DNA recombinase
MTSKKGPKSKSGGKNLSMKDLTKKAALYVRKSDTNDKREGPSASLSDQIHDCELWAKANDMTIVKQFVEPLGTSVSKTLKNSKQFHKGIDGLGLEYQTLICWELTRFSRLNSLNIENAQWLHRVAESGGRVLSLDGKIDTSNLDEMANRVMLNLGFEFAAEESKKISERVTRGKAGAARRGKFQGGRLPYGLSRKVDENGTPDLVRNDEECKIFEEMCDLIIEGRTTTQIAKTFNDRGVLTHYGHMWEGSKIRKFFKLHHWVGYRTYKGEIICDDNGDPMMMQWGQLLDPAKFYAAKTEINRRVAERRKGRVDRKQPLKKAGNALFSGMSFCGTCNGRLVRHTANHKWTRDDGTKGQSTKHYYICRTCVPQWSVNAETLEDIVSLKALSYLGQQKPISDMMNEVARVWLHQHDVGTMQMRNKFESTALEIEDRKNELLELFTDGLITKEQFKDKTTKLDGKLLTIEAEMASMPAYEVDISPLLDLLSCAEGESLIGEGSPWAALEPHVQRKIINCIVDEIYVEGWDGPKGKGANSNIEERTTITFCPDSDVVEKSLRADTHIQPWRPQEDRNPYAVKV